MDILKLDKIARDGKFTESPAYVPARSIAYFETIETPSFMYCENVGRTGESVPIPYPITWLHLCHGGGSLYVRQTCEELAKMLDAAL